MDFVSMAVAAKMADTEEKKAYWEDRSQRVLAKLRSKRQRLHLDVVNEDGVSRPMKRKISHDIRMGTKLVAPGVTAKLDDVDIAAQYGRLALCALDKKRFKAAVATLNDAGLRLDLKPTASDKAKALFDKVIDLRKIGIAWPRRTEA